MKIPEYATSFERLLLDGLEIHTITYSRTQRSRSFYVAVCYMEDNKEKTYFGKINKFLKVNGNRYAFVACYKFCSGNSRIDLKKEYKKGGPVIEINSIIKKVIFAEDDNSS